MNLLITVISMIIIIVVINIIFLLLITTEIIIIIIIVPKVILYTGINHNLKVTPETIIEIACTYQLVQHHQSDAKHPQPSPYQTPVVYHQAAGVAYDALT